MRVRWVASTALLVGLTLLLPAGCSWRKSAWELGFGSLVNELSVVRVLPVGPYLETTLAGEGLTLTTYAPTSEDCILVLEPEAKVRYVERGVGGRYERGDRRCDAVGYGDPLIRGARKPRSSSLRSSPVPRSQAVFTTLYQDERRILLRGRFPQARRIGWVGADDCVAALENTPACHAAADGGVASMEYRASGKNTLSLVSGEGLCVLVGLAMPPR